MPTEATTDSDLSSTQASETVNRAARAAHEAIDKVAAKAGPALDQLQTAATKAAHTLQDKAEALGQMEDELLDSARVQVRANPLTAVLAALAAGYLLSRILR